MDVEIDPRLSEFRNAEIFAPPSKSYTHRAISVAALSNGLCSIKNPLLSEDTNATIGACKALGAKIKRRGKNLEIIGFDGSRGIAVPNEAIDARNSGTTLRFFTAISSLCDECVELTGDSSLKKRPNMPLLNALKNLGVKVSSNEGKAPIKVCGRIDGGETEIDASTSSQFVSALLLSAPFAKNDTRIYVRGKVRSRPYIEMTLHTMKEAGAKVSILNNYYLIPSDQTFKLREFVIPGDFSSSSYFMAAASLLNFNLVINGLRDSRQGDKAFVSILDKIGSNIRWDKERGTLNVSKGESSKIFDFWDPAPKASGLAGFKVDASNIPDLFPTLVVLATKCKGESEIYNAEHLRYKESDRIKTLGAELKKMGAKIFERRDGMAIEQSDLNGCVLESHGDHRIAMALSIAALISNGKSVIKDAECVKVSYPMFFEDLRKIGACVEVF
jgi:3-phosphoshikimate 1-carboxyvinyltransferase